MLRFLHTNWIVLISLLLVSPVSMADEVAVTTTEVTAQTGQSSETAPDAAAAPTMFTAALPLFTGESFSDKIAAVEAMSNIQDERVLALFQAMLGNKLYYVQADKQIVILDEVGDTISVTEVVAGKKLAVTDTSELTKISVNNKLRRMLRGMIAAIRVNSPKDDIRAAAVREIVTKMDQDAYDALSALIKKETNSSIIEDARVGIALWDLNSDDKDTKIKAIRHLSGSLLPEVKTKLLTFKEKDAQGNFVETDGDIRAAANISLDKIDGRIEFYGILENIVFGISTGSILVLIAIGLAITFGVLRVINMAHGELMMLGAYTTYVVQLMMPNHIDLSIFVAIPLAFLVSGSFGIVIERSIVRFLRGRPLDTLLATFGVGLILQQLVRSIFGPNNRAVETPSFMSGSLEFNPVFAITYNRLYIFIFTIIVFIALVMLLKKTTLGLQVRAVSSNRAIARAMGIRSEWVDSMTFGLGSGIAGMAGVALSQVTNVGPNLGQNYIIDSFMVVVFGGVGSLAGTFTSGSILGLLSKFLESGYGAVVASILVLIFIILFIQRWPRGLFPQKGRAAEADQ